MLYTYIGRKKSIEIWRIDLKCSSFYAACDSESVLCLWTEWYDVRSTVAYFQESFIEI